MSVIDDYVKEIETLLSTLPLKLSTRIQAENRGDIALYLKVEIVFADGSELHAREYFAALPAFTKIAYSYHYQDNISNMIFRYDNTEHYPEISTYPHHKHLRDTVIHSRETSLKEVVDKILYLLFKTKKHEQ